MRALHLFSNWKWTGPAEPAVNVCRGLRAAGADARFACGAMPAEARAEAGTAAGRACVADRARERGLEPVLPELTLAKHLRLIENWRDVRRVRAYAAREGIAVLHAHLPNDHSIAARAAGRSEEARVVRTSYDGEALKDTLRQRRALARTDALLCVASAAGRDAVQRLGFPADRLFAVEAPVDVGRFDAGRAPGLRERGAALLGIDPGAGHVVLGIVARMQTHRRFEVLLEAIDAVRREVPALRVAVVGRGTNQETVAREPARRMGLEEIVKFPGYLDGEDYVAALAAIDFKVFLVPGSDGSCRAVREALAMGRPVIVARRGMLPEIVRDGETGLVVEDEPGPLAAAIRRLAGDPVARRRMGERAAADARSRFSIESTAARVLAAYEATLARPRRIHTEEVVT